MEAISHKDHEKLIMMSSSCGYKMIKNQLKQMNYCVNEILKIINTEYLPKDRYSALTYVYDFMEEQKLKIWQSKQKG